MINASLLSINIKRILGLALAKVTPPVTSSPAALGVVGFVGSNSAPSSCSLILTESRVDVPSVQPKMVRVIVVSFWANALCVPEMSKIIAPIML